MNPSLPKLFLHWSGNYFGSKFKPDHFEALTIQHIPKKELVCESQLMQTKWFDYRLMHPMHATYYFIKLYHEAYRDFCRRSMNHEAAAYVRCIKEPDFLDCREKLSFWRLRQAIDALGMRYDFFLRFAMKWIHRMIGAGKVYPPRPSMLSKNADLLGAAMLAWDELCCASLQFASSPYFRVSNYVQCQCQKAHQTFVIGQIKRRRIPHYSLHAALYLYDIVSIEAAIENFGEQTVSRAINEVE